MSFFVPQLAHLTCSFVREGEPLRKLGVLNAWLFPHPGAVFRLSVPLCEQLLVLLLRQR